VEQILQQHREQEQQAISPLGNQRGRVKSAWPNDFPVMPALSQRKHNEARQKRKKRCSGIWNKIVSFGHKDNDNDKDFITKLSGDCHRCTVLSYAVSTVSTV